MDFLRVQVFLILGLLATSCSSQAQRTPCSSAPTKPSWSPMLKTYHSPSPSTSPSPSLVPTPALATSPSSPAPTPATSSSALVLALTPVMASPTPSHASSPPFGTHPSEAHGANSSGSPPTPVSDNAAPESSGSNPPSATFSVTKATIVGTALTVTFFLAFVLP